MLNLCNENKKSNSITGNIISDVNLETDLTNILEPESSTTTTSTSTSTATETSSPNAVIANNNSISENISNETITQINNASSAMKQKEEQDIDAQKSIIKAKIERLSKIRKEVKEKSITVKSAIEKLKLEDLKEIDIDEIESEEDAAYAAKPKEAPVTAQIAQLGYISKINGSIILRLG